MKFYILAIFVLPFFSMAQNQVSVNADIRGRSCSGGLGLCSNSQISNKTNSGIIAQKISDNNLLFIIDKEQLSPDNEKSLIGKSFLDLSSYEKPSFVQEIDVFISSEVLVKLNVNPKLATIKKGNYPMIIEKDKILISFTVSEK